MHTQAQQHRHAHTSSGKSYANGTRAAVLMNRDPRRLCTYNIYETN